jgi:hypothetical protein
VNLQACKLEAGSRKQEARSRKQEEGSKKQAKTISQAGMQVNLCKTT